MAKKSMQRNSGDPPQNVLYVVLHGLICLVDNGVGFDGYLLDRGDEHIYKGGNFRGGNLGVEPDLDDVKDKALALNDGVQRGAQILDVTKNAILNKAMPQDGAVFARNTIFLPRPSDILHFVCGSPGKNLKDPKSQKELKAQPNVISGTRVFQYFFNDYRTVKIFRVGKNDSFFWECPPPTVINGVPVAVFHLYNEPPTDDGGAASIQHSLFEFNDSLLFMQADKVQLTDAILKVMPGDGLPPQLTPDQVCPFAVRDQVTAALNKKPIKRTKKEKFLITYGKDDRGGAGGTQVCGGING